MKRVPGLSGQEVEGSTNVDGAKANGTASATDTASKEK